MKTIENLIAPTGLACLALFLAGFISCYVDMGRSVKRDAVIEKAKIVGIKSEEFENLETIVGPRNRRNGEEGVYFIVTYKDGKVFQRYSPCYAPEDVTNLSELYQNTDLWK